MSNQSKFTIIYHIFHSIHDIEYVFTKINKDFLLNLIYNE